MALIKPIGSYTGEFTVIQSGDRIDPASLGTGSATSTTSLLGDGTWGNISNAGLVNSTITLGSTSISLGATAGTLTGLTSVSSTAFVGALTGNASTASAWATGRTITLTGDATGVSGTFDGSANLSFATSISAATVTGKLLTGYTVGSNTAIAATDSILGAFGKTQGQINSRVDLTSAQNVGGVKTFTDYSEYNSASGIIFQHAVSTSKSSIDVTSYRNSSNTATGAIVIVLPTYVSGTMCLYRVTGQLYNTSTIDFYVSNYRATSTTWNNTPKVVHRGSTAPQVRTGYDGTNHVIIIGDVADVWSYPHINVAELMTSHTGGGNSSQHIGHTMSLVTDLSAYTGLATATVQNIVSSITGTATSLAGGAASQIHYQTGSGVSAFLATANDGVLKTSATGVPSISTTLPSGLTIADFRGTTSTAVTAAGTTQGTATALTTDYSVVSTVVDGADGVILSSGVAGKKVKVKNTAAHTLKVYPPTSGTIDSQAANLPYYLPNKSSVEFNCISTNVWHTVISLTPTNEIKNHNFNLLVNGHGSSRWNRSFTGLTFTEDYGVHAGTTGYFSSTGVASTVVSDEFITVDTTRKYRLGAWCLQSGTSTTSIFYIGLSCFDIDGLTITPQYYLSQASTETTLATDLNNGDSVVNLTSSANWNNAAGGTTYLRSLIFWNYADSTGRVYEAGEYSRNSFLNVYADGGISGNVITLSTTWAGGFFAAGTKVSNGSSGSSYQYLGWVGQIPSNVSPEYRSGTITGIHALSISAVDYSKFPRATASVKVELLLNRAPDTANSNMQISGIQFTDIGIVNTENLFIGTTSIALNRASASQALTGITSIDGSASAWTTGRTITTTGDATGVSGAWTGSGNISFALTIPSATVTLAKMANLAANSIIGNNTGSSAVPSALTATQVRTLINVADGATANTGTVTSITLTQPSAGLTITGSGSAITTTGTPTFALANDLLAVEGLATTGIVRRTATDTWSAGTAVSLTTEVTGLLPNGNLANTTVTVGSTAITLGSSATTIAGLTSVNSTTFVGALTGNATTSTTATNIAGGTANQIPYQTGAGATAFYSGANYGVQTCTATGVPSSVAGAAGVLQGSASAIPTFTTTPTLTGTNFTGIPNGALTNSSLTIGSTSVALGSTTTTFVGLTSVTSTTFVGALTGNASTATSLAGGATSQLVYQSGSGVSAFLSTANNGVLVTNGSGVPSISTTLPSGLSISSILGSVSSAVSAAGTTQGTATAISSDYNAVTTVGSGQGVILPTTTVGRQITVANKGANALLVYPPTSSAIDALGTNTGYSLAVGSVMVFFASTSTLWYSEASSGGGGTTTNALTINNGGAGVASGGTFNGSAAITLSYNSIGAPSTTGTNATGTWAINISGTADDIAGGTANQIPYQTGAGVTLFYSGANYGVQTYTATGVPSSVAGAAGVLQGSASAIPTFTTTPTLTGTNFTGIPNGALTNSSLTIGSTSVALGSTTTTFAGLTSVTSTTFVGALTGNSSTATALAGGATSQLVYQSGSSVSAFLSTANNGVLITSGTGVPSISSTLPTGLTIGNMLISVSSAVSAAGTTQGTATAITSDLNAVTTVASGTGVILPATTVGRQITVANKGANALLVYPPTSSAIDALGTNVGYSLAVGAVMVFYASTSTLWYSESAPATSTTNIAGGTVGQLPYQTGVGTTGFVATGSTGQLLRSAGAAIPVYTTSTYPATNAINTILYASAANVMSALATANSGVLVTSGTGVPSISTTLPSSISRNTVAAISAAGTTQGTATAITGDVSQVTTVASGTGVILPASVAGKIFRVANKGANPLLVYPPTSSQINALGTNVGFLVATNTVQEFVCVTTTLWYANTIPYREIPVTVTNATYSFTLNDAGKGFGKDNTTAYTYTIPANASVVFPIGTVITVFNNNATSNITIAITTDTLRLAGTATTGSRTLAPFGVCTLYKVAATTWMASGPGLT